jgi:pyruvate/2-oxoglutarate dehydrogenase complex dihydrolipoamide dehydrogenase (E3) component
MGETTADVLAIGSGQAGVPLAARPQVAGVGLNEKEARARGVVHEVATMPFGDVARPSSSTRRRAS